MDNQKLKIELINDFLDLFDPEEHLDKLDFITHEFAALAFLDDGHSLPMTNHANAIDYLKYLKNLFKDLRRIDNNKRTNF